jgi:hypothetical protein
MNIFASRKDALARIEICNQCEEYKFKICDVCGCFMPAKVSMFGSSCPKDKWKACTTGEVTPPFNQEEFYKGL